MTKRTKVMVKFKRGSWKARPRPRPLFASPSCIPLPADVAVICALWSPGLRSAELAKAVWRNAFLTASPEVLRHLGNYGSCGVQGPKAGEDPGAQRMFWLSGSLPSQSLYKP